MQKRTLICLFTLITCLTAWVVAEPTTTHAQETEKVTLSDTSLAAESVVYNAATGTFLVGSVSNGTIYEVAQDGTVTRFIQEEALTASVGMYLDAANSKLYVVDTSLANRFLGRRGDFNGGQPPADGSQGGQPLIMGQMNSSIALFIFDLNTKQQLSKIDLTNVAVQQGLRFAYDVTLDQYGNAYVTDSLAGAIYRIDPQGTVAYMSDAKFETQNNFMMGGAPPQDGTAPDQGAGAPPQGGMPDRGLMAGALGLTGIVYHPNGYLIVAKSGEGKLFKIPLDNPQNVTEITLPEAVTGARDIQLTVEGKLLVTSGTQQTVFVLTSADQWATAAVENKIAVENSVSAIALKADEVWVLQSNTVAQEGTDHTTPEVTQVLQRLSLS